MKGFFMKWVLMLSWLISALVTINVGLCPFGFDFFKTDFVLMNMDNLVPLMHYIILASGLISLALFVMSCMGHCDKCNGKSSSCGCK